MNFLENYAGKHVDQELERELFMAGIEVKRLPDGMVFPNSEVITSVYGSLHKWKFDRAWRYWVCEGPGIPFEQATRLDETHGNYVRVDGHCGCPSPKEWFKGLGVNSYHVDTLEGLKALADTIKEIVESHK